MTRRASLAGGASRPDIAFTLDVVVVEPRAEEVTRLTADRAATLCWLEKRLR